MSLIRITFDELKKNNWTGVTDYCRYLVDINSAATRIEVYREDLLCLIVNDVAKAATIMAKDCHWIKYDKTRRKATQEARTAV